VGNTEERLGKLWVIPNLMISVDQTLKTYDYQLKKLAFELAKKQY
jgi:Na+-transporting NADH:ubiquinone oxidoreductase subunit NqrD